MGIRREFWILHVAAWRRSGISVRGYAEQNGLSRGTLGHWSSKVSSEARFGVGMVEVAAVRAPVADACPVERPVEVLVGGRHVLRAWSGTPEAHLGMVLSVLGRQS